MGLQSEMMFLNDNLEKSSFLSEITIHIGQIREMMRYLFRLLWRGDGSPVRGDVPKRLPGEPHQAGRAGGRL